MGKLQSIRDFSGGVVNQELQNRDDGRGVIIDCKNVLSSPNGELRKRTGTKMLAKLPYKAKLVPFRLPNGNDAILVFTQRGDGTDSTVGKVVGYNYGDGELTKFYNVDLSNVVEMPDPTTWTSNVNGDWEINTNSNATRFYNIFRTYFTPQQGTYIDTERCWIDYSTSSEPIIFDIGNTQSPLVLLKIKFFFAGEQTGNPNTAQPMYLGDPTIEYSDDKETWAPVQTVYNVDSQLITYTGKIFHSTVITYGYESTVTVSQSVVFSGHKYWRVSFANKVHISGSRQTMIPLVEWAAQSGTTSFSANTNFGVDDIDLLQYSQSENNLYITSGTNKTPQRISYSNGSFVVSDFVPLVGGISIWETHGNPACVSVFQNRLCFAGFDAFRGRVIMSEFGNLENFTIPEPILSTSPIIADSLQLKSRIDFLWSGDKALYGLSAEGVSMIDAGDGVVATDQIEFKLRNREPAAGILPTVKDDIMIYVGRDGQKILITDYDFVVQRYKAIVLSVGYNDFLQYGIKSIHYIPTKARLIYGILNNGQGFVVLFEHDLNKNSIYPLAIEGNIVDIVPIKHNEMTKLLMIVNKNNQWFILQKDPQYEKQLMDFMPENEKQSYSREFLKNNTFLDYYNKFDTPGVSWFPLNIPETTDIPQVIVDGQYVGDFEPITYNLHVLKNTEFNTYYYVKDISDGEQVWIINEDTGLWKYYGTLGVSENTISVNSIVVIDNETTRETLCCEMSDVANNINYGLSYDSYAVIKFATPYVSRKFPKRIAVNFINTGYLEMGNTFSDLRPVLSEMSETFSLNNQNVLLNGNYEKTLDKQAFETPYVIVSSSKGLPFIITGMDYEVDYSNYQGGV